MGIAESTKSKTAKLNYVLKPGYTIKIGDVKFFVKRIGKTSIDVEVTGALNSKIKKIPATLEFFERYYENYHNL